ncbi:mitochondrial carrier [Linderina pennispora]|uniref:Mitochondrial carrier n=1 Tax=Linderina pennispora TaxID=61395 RepID=A0A1Y1VQJ2_9FUNG|nr:mitochondrial carrier [Linderina pennispora]ORX63423.1 mitochondrial carrier [Linderina pennispora]
MAHEPRTPNNLQCLIAGGLAGMAVDTALPRLQAKGGFLASGGFRGIYAGLSSAVIGSSPGAAMFFLTYEKVKAMAERRAVHMFAASAGEVAACMVRVPTEVIKQRLQTKHHPSLGKAVRGTYHAEGILGFYRGYLTTVVREIPFTCIQFPIYEYMKAAVCGSISGGFAAAVTTPLDVVKTRVMLSMKGMEAHMQYSGIGNTLVRIAREEGFRALFSGVVPGTIWISIGGFVFLGSYEKVKAVMMDHKNPFDIAFLPSGIWQAF